jgi:hypothetical protein
MEIRRMRGGITIRIALAVMAVDSILFGAAVAASRTPALKIWLGFHLVMVIVGGPVVAAILIKRHHRYRARRSSEHRRAVMKQILEFSASQHHIRY